jgi:hypothetical protein
MMFLLKSYPSFGFRYRRYPIAADGCLGWAAFGVICSLGEVVQDANRANYCCDNARTFQWPCVTGKIPVTPIRIRFSEAVEPANVTLAAISIKKIAALNSIVED